MAHITINTTSPQYQNYLAGIRDLKAAYAPRIRQYLKASEERQAIWRQNDPILDELIDIYEKIDRRVEA
jgi:hypothetical protein